MITLSNVKSSCCAKKLMLMLMLMKMLMLMLTRGKRVSLMPFEQVVGAKKGNAGNMWWDRTIQGATCGQQATASRPQLLPTLVAHCNRSSAARSCEGKIHHGPACKETTGQLQVKSGQRFKQA